MIILIHSSKTMRPPASEASAVVQRPQLLSQAAQLAARLQQVSSKQLEQMMQVSPKLAASTHELLASWTDDARVQRPAVDSFLGDIYSGLQVATWSDRDRAYANKHLRILSGLYGVLRPLDGIYPYRLELGYRLPALQAARRSHTPSSATNLYEYWGDAPAGTLPVDPAIINLAALEYSRLITAHCPGRRFITPKFLTVSPKTGLPTFVTVHAKIARGAFTHWLITQRISDPRDLPAFCALGYQYSPVGSSPDQPVYICQEFGGLGLSVRLL